MKKHLWFSALIALLLAALACGGLPGEAAPQLAGTITHSAPTPVSSIEAKEAIQVYARDVLGFEIPSLVAGGTSGEINLPVTTKEGVDVAIGLAGTTYLGFWKEGAASVSFGDSEISGDWVADVEDGTLGAFAIRLEQAFPPDAPTALGLILSAYPGLSGYEFFETPVEQGFGFTAGQVDDIHIQGWEATLTGTTINVGASPGVREGITVVWVVVATGALATPFNP